MKNVEESIAVFNKHLSIACRPASDEHLEFLRDYDYPEIIIEFYARYEPEDPIDCGPCIFTIPKLIELCDEDPVGSAAYEANLFPFGDLMCGDTLCFDPGQIYEDGWLAVVAVSHETVDEDSDEDEVRDATTNYCDSFAQMLGDMAEECERHFAR